MGKSLFFYHKKVGLAVNEEKELLWCIMVLKIAEGPFIKNTSLKPFTSLV
jgi:hypothetical protein